MQTPRCTNEYLEAVHDYGSFLFKTQVLKLFRYLCRERFYCFRFGKNYITELCLHATRLRYLFLKRDNLLFYRIRMFFQFLEREKTCAICFFEPIFLLLELCNFFFTAQSIGCRIGRFLDSMLLPILNFFEHQFTRTDKRKKC